MISIPTIVIIAFVTFFIGLIFIFLGTYQTKKIKKQRKMLIKAMNLDNYSQKQQKKFGKIFAKVLTTKDMKLKKLTIIYRIFALLYFVFLICLILATKAMLETIFITKYFSLNNPSASTVNFFLICTLAYFVLFLSCITKLKIGNYMLSLDESGDIDRFLESSEDFPIVKIIVHFPPELAKSKIHADKLSAIGFFIADCALLLLWLYFLYHY